LSLGQRDELFLEHDEAIGRKRTAQRRLELVFCPSAEGTQRFLIDVAHTHELDGFAHELRMALEMRAEVAHALGA
jgi:hypothetical protein